MEFQSLKCFWMVELVRNLKFKNNIFNKINDLTYKKQSYIR